MDDFMAQIGALRMKKIQMYGVFFHTIIIHRTDQKVKCFFDHFLNYMFKLIIYVIMK